MTGPGFGVNAAGHAIPGEQAIPPLPRARLPPPSRAPFGAKIPACVLPFATFFAVTNFLVDHVAAAFLVTAATYGFTTSAMLVPALYEFDIAMDGFGADLQLGCELAGVGKFA